jgi:predicted phosphodiesterase
MKILTLSDRVEPVLYDQFDRRQFEDVDEDVDLILACGDLPPEYLSFISGKLNVPLYFVRGNHDLRYDAGPPQGCVNLVDELVQFSGKNILGLEGSRWYNGGPHQYTEREMQRKIRRLRPRIWWKGGVDIVITHAPPRHIHDAEDRCHRGFKSFRRLLDTIVNRTNVINTYGYYVFDFDDTRDAE